MAQTGEEEEELQITISLSLPLKNQRQVHAFLEGHMRGKFEP